DMPNEDELEQLANGPRHFEVVGDSAPREGEIKESVESRTAQVGDATQAATSVRQGVQEARAAAESEVADLMGAVTRNGETLREQHAQMMAALWGRQYTKALREAEEELMATTVDPGTAHTLYGTGQQYADYLASATKATAGFLANRAQ